ncbi:DUF6338 family protein [Cohnella luojiensis]|uniref:Uncharacterized protein n=1 Tax=Cohnella luojiensis TaxID=652876 RepID=A0A4Y8LMY5_9BACL|nr:DUF6338 family protein [Cohnella luojiensis]TFE19347.1 hypothetical protein E2980_23490 [Cohnella luojiensis]
MELSDLTIRLLLLFFPGIIATLILDKLTTHRGRELKDFILYSFILGLTSYSILYIAVEIINLINNTTLTVQFIEALTNGKSTINIKEVFFATLISFILGVLVSIMVNRKMIHRAAQKLKITKKFGDSDVWQYIFESPDIEWITIRDLSNDLVYQGWVSAYSDTHDNNELFLRDVIVYRNSDGSRLYEVKGMYLTKNKDDLIIEFPQIGQPQ